MVPEDRRLIGDDIKTIEFRWPIGMPTCRPIGDGLHEVRTNLTGNRIARVSFYLDMNRRMVLLHLIVKKMRAAPKPDLDLARTNKRKHEKGLSSKLDNCHDSSTEDAVQPHWLQFRQLC
jgi:phage-related protein